jgi:hypothetical protein
MNLLFYFFIYLFYYYFFPFSYTNFGPYTYSYYHCLSRECGLESMHCETSDGLH